MAATAYVEPAIEQVCVSDCLVRVSLRYVMAV